MLPLCVCQSVLKWAGEGVGGEERRALHWCSTRSPRLSDGAEMKVRGGEGGAGGKGGGGGGGGGGRGGGGGGGGGASFRTPS